MAENKERSGNVAPGAKAASGAFTPSGVSPSRRARHKYTVRLWAVRNSRFLEWFYHRFASLFLMLHRSGRRSATAAWSGDTFVEKHVKGFLFDCRMCGQCALSSTGMSCSMNCPKQLRNGPCGGVRANGNCEVEPDMPCVWVQAWNGSRNMEKGDAILNVQKPVNQSLRETSSWLASPPKPPPPAKTPPRTHKMSMIDENPLGPHLPLDPLPGHSSRGRLVRVLRRGEFAVTAELKPARQRQSGRRLRNAPRSSKAGWTASMRWMPPARTATCPRSASAHC